MWTSLTRSCLCAANADKVQEALFLLSGVRTAPYVYVGGGHIGGCFDTIEAHEKGELAKTLAKVGIALPAPKSPSAA